MLTSQRSPSVNFYLHFKMGMGRSIHRPPQERYKRGLECPQGSPGVKSLKEEQPKRPSADERINEMWRILFLYGILYLIHSIIAFMEYLWVITQP